MERYYALKRSEILSYVTTWMKLRDIILSEMSQSPLKGKSCMIPPIRGTYSGQVRRDRKCWFPALGEGNEELLFNGTEFCKMKKSSEDGLHDMNVLNTAETYT